MAAHGERILPLDAQAARLAGQISDAALARGCQPGFADVAIAALAQQGSLLRLTCNLKHFQPLGVACADPLITLPAGWRDGAQTPPHTIPASGKGWPPSVWPPTVDQ